MPYLGVKPAPITNATQAEIVGDLTVDTNTLKVDSSNNRVGVGTSTVDSALHIEQNASGITETSGSTLKIHNTNASGRSKISLHNSAETASGSIYYDTDSGGLALQGDTGAIVAFHTGGNTERGRFDTSGRFLVGKTTSSISDSKGTVITDDGRVDINPSTTNGSGQVDAIRLHNSGTTAGDGAGIKFSAGTSTTGAGIFGIGQAVNSANLVFRTGGDTERMRLDSSGNLLIGTTTSSTAHDPGVVITSNVQPGLFINNSTTSSGVSLILLRASHSTADETKFEVTASGNVKSRTGSYGSFSDERLKEQIVDAPSQWDDIKAIEVKNFKFISELDDADNPKMIGVVAQQIESVSPALVEDDADGMKTVKYSILYMKAVKALQEAMARIETLETEMTSLKARVTALEDA